MGARVRGTLERVLPDGTSWVDLGRSWLRDPGEVYDALAWDGCWLHGVPPCPGLREGRISVQWGWTSRTLRPQVGGGSRAPRRYGGGRWTSRS